MIEILSVTDGSRGSAKDRERDLGVAIRFKALVHGKTVEGSARVAPTYGGSLKADCQDTWCHELRGERRAFLAQLLEAVGPAAQAFASERGWRVDRARWTAV